MYDNNYMQQQYAAQQPTQPQQPVKVASPMQVEDKGIGISFGSLSRGVDLPVLQPKGEVVTTTRKSSKKKSSDESEHKISHSEAVDATIYADTYQDTNLMLKQTISQIDCVAADIKQELDKVMASKLMKGKYMAIGNLSKPLGDALATKVQAIKELNNSIKSINDFEYKRAKDNRAFETGNNDDKAIMDMYNAFIQAPSSNKFGMLGPNATDVMLGGPVVDANSSYATPNGTLVFESGTTASPSSNDPGYEAYMRNLTPEQNAMILESNPDVETVVTYDKSTGAKAFQCMNTVTGEVIHNVPVPDPMFLPDITIDLKNNLARNNNLNQIYRLVVTGGESINEY